MRLYEITLPLATNDGATYHSAHADFTTWLVDVFGGYTATMQNGAWRGPDGALYCEPSVAYRVASDLADAPRMLLHRAKELFPDQLAIFWANMGEGHVHEVVRGTGQP